VPFLLALALQVGPNPTLGAIQGDELLQDRPPREEVQPRPEPEAKPDPVSAWLAGCLGTLEEDPARAHAMAQIRRSETTGADRVLANHCLGTASAALELWDDARTAFTAALRLQPDMNTVQSLLGDIALVEGDAAAAARHYAQEQGEVSRLRSLAIIDGRLKGRAAGEVHLARLISQFGDAVHFQRAEVLAQWGDTAAALASLEAALALRDAGLLLAAHDPMLDPLRAEARFQAVIRQIGAAPPVGQA